MSKCLNIKQLSRGVYLICMLSCLSAFAQSSSYILRKPANFVPDDDMIIVPIVIERNFIEEFNDKHAEDFKEARRRLENWLAQEQYAIDYGLENTGVVQLPTPEQKRTFLERNYLRFIQKDVEQSNQQTLNDFMNDWNTNDEIDSISANEQRDEFIVKAKKNKGQKIYKAKKEVKIAGKKFKFDIQPRLEMGMIKLRIDTPYFDVRGWLGINGNQEINLSRRFAATGTNSMVNYYIEQNRVLAVIDQPLAYNWSLRLTHDKIIKDFDSTDQTLLPENNSFQLRFGMGF